MLSPDGRFMSGSTHMPPTGIHCPAATFCVMRASSSGSRSAIHSYCWACEHEKRYDGIVVHQPDGRGERADALADGLGRRPQPGRVDVGVPRGHDAMGVGPGRHGQRRRQRRPRRIDGVGDVAGHGHEIEGAGDGVADAGPPRVVECERPHHAVEHLEVEDQRLGRLVDDDELGPVEPVQQPVAGGGRRAQVRRPELGEGRVGGGLDDEHDGAGSGRDGDGLAAGVDALDGAAPLVAHEALALEAGRVEPEPEVEQRLDPPRPTSATGPRR